MGLRCSILGHTFDETEVRRDRRERGSGNEVVTVVAQVERCSRCGTERIVSENKEVVSVVDADEVGLDDESENEDAAEAERSGPAADPSGAGSPGPATRDDLAAGLGSSSDAEPDRDDGESVASADHEADPDPVPDRDPASESAADPSEEDVEFITETEGSLGGGEDVADDEDVPSDAREGDSSGGIGGMAARSGAFDGDANGSDGGSSDGSAEDDAEILDEPESDPERAPGQWPDEPEDEPWEPGSFDGRETTSNPDPGPEPESQSDPDVEPVADSSFTVPEGSLKCPNCGYEVSAASSFRAGDACPECQTGYLESADGE